MQCIKQIVALDTFPVRHPVLRAKKLIENCRFEGDTLETTLHFELYAIENLPGVTSLFEAKNDLFSDGKQFQINGMAVLKQNLKKGCGEKLILTSEKCSRNQNVNLILFNTNKEAIGFYEKMSYQTRGLPFKIKDVGEHVDNV